MVNVSCDIYAYPIKTPFYLYECKLTHREFNVKYYGYENVKYINRNGLTFKLPEDKKYLVANCPKDCDAKRICRTLPLCVVEEGNIDE